MLLRKFLRIPEDPKLSLDGSVHDSPIEAGASGPRFDAVIRSGGSFLGKQVHRASRTQVKAPEVLGDFYCGWQQETKDELWLPSCLRSQRDSITTMDSRDEAALTPQLPWVKRYQRVLSALGDLVLFRKAGGTLGSTATPADIRRHLRSKRPKRAILKKSISNLDERTQDPSKRLGPKLRFAAKRLSQDDCSVHPSFTSRGTRAAKMAREDAGTEDAFAQISDGQSGSPRSRPAAPRLSMTVTTADTSFAGGFSRFSDASSHFGRISSGSNALGADAFAPSLMPALLPGSPRGGRRRSRRTTRISLSVLNAGVEEEGSSGGLLRLRPGTPRGPEDNASPFAMDSLNGWSPDASLQGVDGASAADIAVEAGGTPAAPGGHLLKHYSISSPLHSDKRAPVQHHLPNRHSTGGTMAQAPHTLSGGELLAAQSEFFRPYTHSGTFSSPQPVPNRTMNKCDSAPVEWSVSTLATSCPPVASPLQHMCRLEEVRARADSDTGRLSIGSSDSGGMISVIQSQSLSGLRYSVAGGMMREVEHVGVAVAPASLSDPMPHSSSSQPSPLRAAGTKFLGAPELV